MNDRISISIDCDDEKETPRHSLTIGDVSRFYTNEADLADELEFILADGPDVLAA